MRIAAAQFPVSGNLQRNSRAIRQLMVRAHDAGATVVHFPETALPGYAPAHPGVLEGDMWPALERHTQHIRDEARALGLWVVLGTMRRVAGARPRNSLLVISASGEVVATYDKRRLYGRETSLYSPGDSDGVVDIEGIRCGLLICYENCFPSLYADYAAQGVELVFHSFHNAANRRMTPIAELMRASLVMRAADHGVSISASNSSARTSPLVASVLRPDGSAVRAKRHVTGLAVTDHPAELGWTIPGARAGERIDRPVPILRRVSRGEVYWLCAGRPGASGIAHPHVVVQDDVFNHSRLDTVVVCALSTHPKRANEPGNVLLDEGEANLPRRSVVVVSQVEAVHSGALGACVGVLSPRRVEQVLAGMRFLQTSGFVR